MVTNHESSTLPLLFSSYSPLHLNGEKTTIGRQDEMYHPAINLSQPSRIGNHFQLILRFPSNVEMASHRHGLICT